METKSNAYERQKARQRERYAIDPEFRRKSKEYHKKYNQDIRDNPVKLEAERERRRKYYMKHRDKMIAYQKNYYREHIAKADSLS